LSTNTTLTRYKTYLQCGGGVAVSATCPDLGSGRCETLGKSFTVADVPSFSLPSLMMSGSWGVEATPAPLSPSTAFGLAPKIESSSPASPLMEEALLMCPVSPCSAARRSFSRRVSRPRLWQYQNTKSSTITSQPRSSEMWRRKDLPNTAKLIMTFVPVAKAGNLNFKKLTILLSAVATAP
jgi:hypothetical protein